MVNGGHTGNVADADPRTISNLIVDMTINNPAALVAALAFAEIRGAEALAIVEQVQALMQEARFKHAAVAGAAAAAAAVAAAELVVDAKTIAQDDAQTAFEDAQGARDGKAIQVGLAGGALADAVAAEAAQDAVLAAAQNDVTEARDNRQAAVAFAAATESAKNIAAFNLTQAQADEQAAELALENDPSDENLRLVSQG